MTDFENGVAAGMIIAAKTNSTPTPVIDPDYEFFKNLPEPAENQAVYLIRWSETMQTIQLNAYCFLPSDTAANLTVDWGDGTIETLNLIDSSQTSDYQKYFTHIYEKSGEYIVIITTDNVARCRCWWFYSNKCRQTMAKYGEKIHLELYSKKFGAYPINNYLQYVKIPSDTVFDQGEFFSSCYSLRRIEFSGKITSIPKQTFYNCNSLKSLDNWDLSAVEQIDTNAFYKCYSLQSINLPECATIADYVFQDCRKLQTVIMPKCQSVNVNAFYNNNSLEEITMSVCTAIGNQAFYGCYSLEKITVPMCTTVGSNTFYDCYFLQDVTFADDCTFSSNSFVNCRSLYPIPG